jgi:hypothetical protein
MKKYSTLFLMNCVMAIFLLQAMNEVLKNTNNDFSKLSKDDLRFIRNFYKSFETSNGDYDYRIFEQLRNNGPEYVENLNKKTHGSVVDLVNNYRILHKIINKKVFFEFFLNLPGVCPKIKNECGQSLSELFNLIHTCEEAKSNSQFPLIFEQHNTCDFCVEEKTRLSALKNYN